LVAIHGLVANKLAPLINGPLVALQSAANRFLLERIGQHLLRLVLAQDEILVVLPPPVHRVCGLMCAARHPPVSVPRRRSSAKYSSYCSRCCSPRSIAGYAADMARMAADPKTQEWWKITDPMQEPVPEHGPDQWWTPAREVFHID